MTTLMQAHEQWAKRPADERFLSLHEMQAKMRSLRDRSAADVQSTRKTELLPDETDLRHRSLNMRHSLPICGVKTDFNAVSLGNYRPRSEG